MEALQQLRELLEKEVEKVVKKGDMTPVELDNMKKVVEVLCKMNELDSSMNGYSGSYGRMYPRYSMDGGRSGDRSYGDPFRPSWPDYSYDGRGRSSEGYSGHGSNEAMVQNLRQMMTNAQSDRERGAIADCIDRLTNR